MKRLTIKTKLVSLALVGLAGILLWTQQTTNMSDVISSGGHGYTRRAGWVNWRHAKPKGALSFLNDLRAKWREAQGQKFGVTYTQKMSGVYFGVQITSSVEHGYELGDIRDLEALHRAAWVIFQSVSEDFECMQETLPDAIIADSRSSSYRDGDLMGNLVGYHCALHSLTLEQARDQLGSLTAQESISYWTAGQQAKNRTWQPHDWLGQAGLPPHFQPPRVTKEWRDNHVRLTSRKLHSYRPSWPQP
jgi:hypothetical protein